MPESRESRITEQMESIDCEIRELEQRLFVLRCVRIDWQRELREVSLPIDRVTF